MADGTTLVYPVPTTSVDFIPGAEYQVLSGTESRKGNYGFYFEAQQMMYRRGGAGSDVGLTPWISVTFSRNRVSISFPSSC
jgi:hypothetical protein